ncbi:MAG: hypothetical protein OEZ09_08615 [Betaproteobacteria bacterium]|nr:hypothetical protein [Betaproteobacteria bacterium]MDH4324468.1 hypothetical protein [Betaproteobacteria bacterium]MDH5211810.1 hypothetical protein [Betaproteobacteria bacterium]MDH5578511.1 hypothetical protein [Betaproteobacteria bacterium]
MKTAKSLTAALAFSALSGCYVVPGPDGQLWHVIPGHPGGPASIPPPAAAGGAAQPVSLPVRLYPANEEATRTGVLTGSVINMMTGKGRFQLSYQGETLTGEATRVDGDARKGVASAYGPTGMFMSCEYQMNSPRQGAGTCSLSNGAKYQVHIGS